MNDSLPSFRGRLEEVRARIADAAGRSGRPSESVLLVGVVKTVPLETVLDAVAAGLADLGENRVQEAEPKIEAVGSGRVRWHMIGHLQRNKAGRAAMLFDRVHGVDSPGLARELSRRAVEGKRTISALIQVNVSGEASKHGIATDALVSMLDETLQLPGLRIEGLMSMGPAVDRAELARPYFARTRELRDAAARSLGVSLPELSMGMSGDFEVAIEEGSTLVRLGTALFGTRR